MLKLELQKENIKKKVAIRTVIFHFNTLTKYILLYPVRVQYKCLKYNKRTTCEMCQHRLFSIGRAYIPIGTVRSKASLYRSLLQV
jgi:hypothetical protein